MNLIMHGECEHFLFPKRCTYFRVCPHETYQGFFPSLLFAVFLFPDKACKTVPAYVKFNLQGWGDFRFERSPLRTEVVCLPALPFSFHLELLNNVIISNILISRIDVLISLSPVRESACRLLSFLIFPSSPSSLSLVGLG